MSAPERQKLTDLIARLVKEPTGEWARQGADHQLRQRILMVLACDRGLSNTQVARQFGVRTATVWKWRERFRLQRAQGLLDLPRPGRPKKVRATT